MPGCSMVCPYDKKSKVKGSEDSPNYLLFENQLSGEVMIWIVSYQFNE